MSDRRGFTLVEVVLSLAILAMVVATVFAVLRLAHRAERKGTARSEASQRVMVLADRLSWLLAGAYPYKKFDKDTEKEVLFFEGDGDRLAFVTTSVDKYSGDITDLPGLKFVQLSLGPEGMRADERVFYMTEAELAKYVLEPNVTSLEIEYMEQDAETGQTEWVGDWDPDGKDYLPVAVSFLMELELDGRKIKVPRVIVKLPVGGARGVPVPFPRRP